MNVFKFAIAIFFLYTVVLEHHGNQFGIGKFSLKQFLPILHLGNLAENTNISCHQVATYILNKLHQCMLDLFGKKIFLTQQFRKDIEVPKIRLKTIAYNPHLSHIFGFGRAFRFFYIVVVEYHIYQFTISETSCMYRALVFLALNLN